MTVSTPARAFWDWGGDMASPACQKRRPSMGSAARQVRNVFELDSLAVPQATACPCDSVEEPRVILQLVVEPVFFTGESDQDARWLAVARNHQRLFLGHAEILGQIVLNLG